MFFRDKARSIVTLAIGGEATTVQRTAKAEPPVERVVLLCDKSSSMATKDCPPATNRLDAAKQAILAFHNAKRGIDPRDRIAVVLFDGGPRLVSGFDDGNRLPTVLADVVATKPSGGTAIGLAMEQGLDLLAAGPSQGTVGRMVVLSDGGTNLGIHPRRLIDRCKKSGVIVDTVGIGSARTADYRKSEPMLIEVARATGGTFVHCRDLQALLSSYRRLAEKKPRRPAIVTLGWGSILTV